MPTNQGALNTILEARDRGDLRTAETLAREHLADKPRDGEVHRLLGQMLLAMEREDEGIAALREALWCQPDDAGLLVELGRALARQGVDDEAIQLLGRASALSPERAELALEASEAAMQGGRVGIAVDVLERARRLHPEDPTLMACFGRALARLGDTEEALALLRHAAELAPANATLHQTLATELRRAGREEAAVEAYARALTLDDCPAEARSGMAEVLMALGRLGEAMEAYDACYMLRHGPEANADPGLRIFGATTTGKLQHDIEQIEYLLEVGEIERRWRANAEAYRRVLAALPTEVGRHRMQVIPEALRGLIAGSYNKLWHKHAPGRLDDGALNPALAAADIEHAFGDKPAGMTAIDDFLRPEAHAALNRFCRESTFWHEYRYGNGCLGASLPAGFTCPLLLQIGAELGARLPGIIAGHRLSGISALSCDEIVGRRSARLDQGALNVNLWLSPAVGGAAGGIEIWDRPVQDQEPGDDRVIDAVALNSFELQTGAQAHAFACRDNRAVLFDAGLPWRLRSAPLRQGFAQRFVLITMSFGDDGATG
jgi:predicted Zn-dependent protease